MAIWLARRWPTRPRSWETEIRDYLSDKEKFLIQLQTQSRRCNEAANLIDTNLEFVGESIAAAEKAFLRREFKSRFVTLLLPPTNVEIHVCIDLTAKENAEKWRERKAAFDGRSYHVMSEIRDIVALSLTEIDGLCKEEVMEASMNMYRRESWLLGNALLYEDPLYRDDGLDEDGVRPFFLPLGDLLGDIHVSSIEVIYQTRLNDAYKDYMQSLSHFQKEHINVPHNLLQDSYNRKVEEVRTLLHAIAEKQATYDFEFSKFEVYEPLFNIDEVHRILKPLDVLRDGQREYDLITYELLRDVLREEHESAIRLMSDNLTLARKCEKLKEELEKVIPSWRIPNLNDVTRRHPVVRGCYLCQGSCE